MGKLFNKLGKFLGSFGLTVTLLLILFLLTWFGTLEQVDHGLYTVQRKYFDSLYVVHYVGSVPILLPGGMATMVLFAINLFVGGMVRIRKTRRNVGVIVAHLGMMFLLVAGAVKQLRSEDGLMRLAPQQQGSVFSSSAKFEVVIWDATTPMGPVTEYRIPPGDVRRLGGNRTRLFKHADLPFEITLGDFVPSSRVVPAAGIGVPQHDVIDGWTVREMNPKDVSDVRIPSLYATVVTPGGEALRGILFGVMRLPWTFEFDGRTWAVALRGEAYDLPFELRLDEFRKSDHPGMGMARSFESDVTRIKPDQPDRQVRIWMNNPLREDDYVVYQAQYDGDSTILQIVKNPSDQWPKWACYVIGVGLMIALTQRLVAYLGQESRRRQRKATA